MTDPKLFLAVVTVLLIAVGCERSADPGVADQDALSNIQGAKADIEPTSGNSGPEGRAVFTPSEEGDVMKVHVSLTGLSPGLHGFHIHQHPDCSNDGKAAGGHFNPTENPHGGPRASRHHVGDLGNIEADSQGRVDAVLKADQLAFTGLHNILNHSVVVHKNRDDLRSQPSGAAGARVACGVIRPHRDDLAEEQNPASQ